MFTLTAGHYEFTASTLYGLLLRMYEAQDGAPLRMWECVHEGNETDGYFDGWARFDREPGTFVEGPFEPDLCADDVIAYAECVFAAPARLVLAL